MKLENDLGRDDIKKLVIRLGVPSMLAQFVNVLYSVVDRIYVGNIPEVGDLALAGVGICGPIVTLLTAFGSLVGLGGAPHMSISMGRNDHKEAKQILSNSFMMLSVISVSIMVFVMMMRERLLWWFGASEITFPYANSYITVYLLGTVFSLLSVGMNQFIIGQGFAKKGMTSVVIGAVTNIVLDPVFIFGLGMGVTGAALATVLSQFASCVYILRFLFGKLVPVRIGVGGYSRKIIGKITRTGLSPFMILAMDNVLIIALNTVLQRYGGANGDQLLACATIMQSCMLVITMPLYGISSGTAPILGYNYGARRSDRILAAQKYILLFALGFTATMFVLAQTGSVFFVRLFTQNVESIRLAVWAIRVYTIGIIPLSVCYVVIDGFTGMGIAKVAACLSIFRKTLFLTSVFLLPKVFGVKAAFFAEGISDIGGALMCGLIYAAAIHPLLRRCEEAE